MVNASKIRNRRKALGMTQVMAASIAGLSSHAIWCNIEAGKRKNITLKTLEAMATALRCSPKSLLK